MINIKKALTTSAVAGAMVASLAMPAFAAKPATVPGPVEYGPWVINAPSTIDFTCGGGEYLHTLSTVNNAANGDLTGSGYYNPDNSYTWDLTGNVTGVNANMQIVYTGAALGSVYNLSGVIDETDGSISGTVDSNCEVFEMPAGTATRSESQFTGNHGQWVKAAENKQEAAQSRVGMPVQSKGHTK